MYFPPPPPRMRFSSERRPGAARERRRSWRCHPANFFREKRRPCLQATPLKSVLPVGRKMQHAAQGWLGLWRAKLRLGPACPEHKLGHGKQLRKKQKRNLNQGARLHGCPSQHKFPQKETSLRHTPCTPPCQSSAPILPHVYF